ncbi:MAG: hypothetical protein U0165_13715 [Polyangiaceae bacterium]
MSDSSPPKAPSEPDVVLLHSATDDGKGVRVIRARNQRIEAGEIRPVEEGKPIVGGELVSLTPRAESPRVCDVKVIHRSESETQRLSHDGPARVSTRAFRDGWDAIFGSDSYDDASPPEPSSDPRQLN